MTDTSISALIQAAYPARYYASVDNGALQMLMDIWAGKTIAGYALNLLTVPPASSLVALTETQWTLAAVPAKSGLSNIFVTNNAINYPDRFYCDRTVNCGVYDMWGFSSPPAGPVLADLYSITADEYADRQTNPRAQFYDTTTGKLADYIVPVVPVPLKDQASAENTGWIQSQINDAAAMGETFTDAMKAYVKAVRAIASGADTTSTALPARPTDIMS